MNDLVFVSAQPDVPYFHWQVEVYVYNFISLGIDPNKIHVIFSSDKPSNGALDLKKWGINIHFYKDLRPSKGYIPSIKPYLISKWLEQYPEFGKAFFLHDSDIIFRELPNFDSMMGDDISYLSDTIGYIGYKYIMDCCQRYEKQHPNSEKGQLLKEMADVVGIDVDIIKNNQMNSGGAQYLIKGTDFKLWDKIYMDCVPLYNQMMDYQMRFPIDPGQIQFWTAEMWSTLWNLWKFGIETKVIKELDFCWATDFIFSYDVKNILHMAGVTDQMKGSKFYKGDFIKINPIDKLRSDPNYFDYIDSKNCTSKYVDVMRDIIKQKK